MSLPLIEADSIPANVRAVQVVWYCDKSEPADTATILKYAGIVASEKGSTTVNIRSGFHSNTKRTQPRKFGQPQNYDLVPDERGIHYTAEYQNSKTRDWRTWHHYFVKDSNRNWIEKEDPQDPRWPVWSNPLWWADDSGKMQAKPDNRRRGADTVWAWRADGVQYFKIKYSPE